MTGERPGYVKLWRKTLESGVLQSGPATQVFIWAMLTTPKWKRTMLVRGHAVVVLPGQVVFALRILAAELNMSLQNLRTALKLLAEMDIVGIKSTHEFSTITLKKWGHYQDGEAEVTQRQHSTNTVPTHPAGKTVVAEGETSAQELKKERTNLGKVELRTKQRGKRELALLLQGYYEVFDPRHPAYREDFPNAQDLSKWEAEKGHPWTPKPKHPEDNR